MHSDDSSRDQPWPLDPSARSPPSPRRTVSMSNGMLDSTAQPDWLSLRRSYSTDLRRMSPYVQQTQFEQFPPSSTGQQRTLRLAWAPPAEQIAAYATSESQRRADASHSGVPPDPVDVPPHIIIQSPTPPPLTPPTGWGGVPWPPSAPGDADSATHALEPCSQVSWTQYNETYSPALSIGSGSERGQTLLPTTPYYIPDNLPLIDEPPVDSSLSAHTPFLGSTPLHANDDWTPRSSLLGTPGFLHSLSNDFNTGPNIDGLTSDQRTPSNPLSRPGYVPGPVVDRTADTPSPDIVAERGAGTPNPVETYRMYLSDEAFALALAQEDGADNQEALLSALRAKSSTSSGSIPPPVSGDSGESDLEYASDASASGEGANPFAPVAIEPLRINRKHSDAQVRSTERALPEVPPRNTPAPTTSAPPPSFLRPRGADGLAFDVLTSPSLPSSLPPYSSRRSSTATLLPACEALSPPSSMLHRANTVNALEGRSVQAEQSRMSTLEAKPQPVLRWWTQSLPASSLRLGYCGCGAGVYRQVMNGMPRQGGLWQRLKQEAHAQCVTGKPTCKVHCSGCGKLRGSCSFRECTGRSEPCDMLTCCPAVRSLAVQSALAYLESKVDGRSGDLDALIHEDPSVVLEVLDALIKLLEIGPGNVSNNERGRAALRWLLLSSSLLNMAWSLLSSITPNRALSLKQAPVFLSLIRFLLMLERAEVISECDQPMYGVDFSRRALETWLTDERFAPELPELVERQDGNNCPLVVLLHRIREQRRGSLVRSASKLTYPSTIARLKSLTAAIDELLAANPPA